MTIEDFNTEHNTYNFFGILSKFDLNEPINENLIEFIIQEKIFIVSKENDFPSLKSFLKNFTNFKHHFYHKSICYELNPKIIKEISNYYFLQISLNHLLTKNFLKDSVETNIKGINDNLDVLKILKKTRNKIVEKNIAFSSKLGFMYGYFNEKTIDENNKGFQSELKTKEIENFLTAQIINEDGVFLSQWKKVNSNRTKINFYTEKIKEIQSLIINELTIKVEKNPFTEIIFKQDGSELFIFINSKYPKEKNTAFYSYLYFYLKDVEKVLNVAGNDSKAYRDFIQSIENINFKRVQNTNSQNKYKQNEMFVLFKNYTQEYYSIKNEINLSNNE